MTGLAHPPNRWEPDTATAAVLSALRPAAIPNGVVKSIADTPATEPWYGSKDGFCAPVRQEGSWWGASALRWESEMDERVQRYCEESAIEVGRHAAEMYSQWLCRFLPDCDSEIERLLCAAFIRLEDLNRVGGSYRFKVTGGLYGTNRPRSFADVRGWAWQLREDTESSRLYEYYYTYCFPQVSFGPYCVDFLVGSLAKRKTENDILRLENWIAVECDGHEFHDKTKEQAQRDKARDRFLVASGVKVMRFTGSEIWRDPTRCALEVVEAADPGKIFHWISEALS